MLVLEGFYYNSWLQLLTQTHHIIHFCQERANGCIWCISIKDDKRIKKVYSLSIRHCTNTYGKVKLPDLQRSADLLSADGPCVVPPRSWDPEPAGICRVWKIASHKLSSILQHSPAFSSDKATAHRPTIRPCLASTVLHLHQAFAWQYMTMNEPDSGQEDMRCTKR